MPGPRAHPPAGQPQRPRGLILATWLGSAVVAGLYGPATLSAWCAILGVMIALKRKRLDFPALLKHRDGDT